MNLSFVPVYYETYERIIVLQDIFNDERARYVTYRISEQMVLENSRSDHSGSHFDIVLGIRELRASKVDDTGLYAVIGIR